MTTFYAFVIAVIVLVLLAIVFSVLSDTTEFWNTFETLAELCKALAMLATCGAIVAVFWNNPLVQAIWQLFVAF